MAEGERVKALLVYPRFNARSFWNYAATCEVVGVRYPAAPLGLITVAALLPPSWDLRLVNCNTEELTEADLAWADLVMTGGMLPQQHDALRIIALAQRHGKPVVVGGPDATSSPNFYAASDFLVLGEAEDIMPAFLAAWDRGERKGVFHAEGSPDLTRSPIPRFDLLKFDQYLTVGVQFSRGCPFNCEFCDIIELYGRVPRPKATAQMLAELDTLWRLGYRGHVDFVDDNLIGNGKALKRFLPELKGWLKDHNHPFEFSTEASINLADDRTLLEMLKEANFFSIFVGIESPDPETLIHTQKKQNTRRVLADSIQKIYQAGMYVNAGFIIGFDTEKASCAQGLIQCIEDTAIPVCMVGLLFALPNTQLTRRLLAEGRLHPADSIDWDETMADQCTSGLNFETTRPRAEVLADYHKVLASVYAPAAYFERVRRVGRQLDCSRRRLKLPLMRRLLDLRTFSRLVLRMGIKDASVRRHWWRTLFDVLLHNPFAIKDTVSMMALYLHLGPFAASLAERLEEQMAALADGTAVLAKPIPAPGREARQATG